MHSEELANRIRARLPGAVMGGHAGDGAADPPRPEVPDHEMLRKIGSGCYGEVWLARGVTGALRAVKAVWRHTFSSDRPYEREFQGIIAFEPLSRSHPGVISILHVGRDDEAGCFFYVMELADDATGQIGSGNNAPISIADYTPRTLRHDLQTRGRLPIQEVLILGVQLADALGQLHRNGLVHRDVKPSNVVFVQGHPKLADIGLVASSDEARSFVGTEGFIPPEGHGTARADLFSLGRLLYEAATGRDRCDFPSLPEDLDGWPATEREPLLELNDVLAKMCAPEVFRRHDNVAAVAGDLNMILSGRSVRRAYGVERRLKRATRFSAVAAGVIALAGAVVWFQGARQEEAERRAAREHTLRQRAEAAERDSSRQLLAALIEQAQATVRSGEVGQRVRTLSAIQRAAAIANVTELRSHAFAALGLPDLRLENDFPTGLDCTLAVLDPKFERVALGRGTDAVEIRSVNDWSLLAALAVDRETPVSSGKWSPDGRFLAIAGWKRPKGCDVEIWDAESATQVMFLPRTPWGAFAFHPNHPWILCSDVANSVALWDLESGREINRFPLTGSAYLLEFSPDGQTFLAQHGNERPWTTSEFETASGTVRSSAISGWVDGIAWHPRGQLIALSRRSGEVILHDRATGVNTVLGRHKTEARTVVFSPDGDFLFSGGEEQEILCWDLRSMQRAFGVSLQSAQMQIRADGKQCAVIARTGITLHAWEHTVPFRELRGDLGGSANHGVISRDGHWLAIAGGYHKLGLWDLESQSPAAIVRESNIISPFFSPDSSELFAFWDDGFVRWRLARGATAADAPRLDPLPVYKPARLLAAGFAGDSLVLGMPSGAMVIPADSIASGPGQLFNIGSAQGRISPDGMWAAIRKRAPHREEIYQLNPWYGMRFVPTDAEILAEAFTPQGDELAVATYTSVTFLDSNQWETRRRFPVALDRNAHIIFTPDGAAFWLIHDAGTAALHDTQTFETLLPLPPGFIPLAVSPDGRDLVLSVGASHMQVWDLQAVRARFRDLGVDWTARRDSVSSEP